MSKQLTWVIAHEPYDLFLNATRHFAEEVPNRTDGRYTVRVISLEDWSNENGIEISYKSADRHKVINLVRNGGVDIATTYVENLGLYSRDFYALGIPYLFTDDAHATRVLDGVLGRQILDSLNQHDNSMVGLAFTYSGGFRIVVGDRKIERIEDFNGSVVFCSRSPVSVDTFNALGADTISDNIDFFKDALDAGEVNLGSTTYARFFSGGYNTSAKFINHTEHSLFLTAMIMNSESFNIMSAEDQQIVRDLAVECAGMERLESVADNARVQAEAAAAGVPTIFMSTEEKARMVAAVQPVKDKYYDVFTSGLLRAIEAA